jgi:amino acid transporter
MADTESTYQMKTVDPDQRLKRSIGWPQGLAIAMGVPLLILPSLGDMPFYVSAAAILVWGLSVLQGFMQNMAYAEMATAFPRASGLPGFAQEVFRTRNHQGKHDRGQLIGGFSAWSYWFAWNPVMAIFSLLVGSYLHGLFPALGQTFTEYQLSMMAGVVIFAGLFVINWFGLGQGAILGYILGIGALIPVLILAVTPFATGDVDLANITGSWLPSDWAWDTHHVLMLFGIFAIAQWSACAWETAAVYGPEYKDPSKDLPKALFSAGVLCLILYVLVQSSVIGVLGVEGVLEQPYSPLLPVARVVFGEAGTMVAITLLIASMVLIIQTAFLGSSRAMHSMATEGNLPRVLGRTNRHGTPFLNMLVIAIFNLALISMGTPGAILAASAIGYTCANGISLFSYVKANREPEFKGLERPFKAPRNWTWVAIAFGLFNLPLCFIGVVYLNSLEIGWSSTWVAFIVLGAYIPIWFYSQAEFRRLDRSLATTAAADDSSRPAPRV